MAMEGLPLEWHFLPKHPEKNIKFYKSILIQQKFARIENIMNKGDPLIVLYHKFIITGFANSKEWVRHPSLLKTLTDLKSLTSSKLYYSYYDYMDALEKVLFYQNKNFDHSWFLMFDKKFSSPIPSWFLKWWEMFGSVPHIFLEPLQRPSGILAPGSKPQIMVPNFQQFCIWQLCTGSTGLVCGIMQLITIYWVENSQQNGGIVFGLIKSSTNSIRTSLLQYRELLLTIQDLNLS